MASLDFLKVLIKNTEYLLVLGTYRDSEITSLHPLTLALEQMVKAGAIVNTIKLHPLSKSDLYRLVSDTLNCQGNFVVTLIQSIERKTEGNPFYVIQFLRFLYEKNLIYFDEQEQYWQCKSEEILALALKENIVDFMLLQLQKLPQEIQLILTFAACLGTKFKLKTLAIVSKQSPENVATALWKAWQENLVTATRIASPLLAISESYEVLNNSTNPTYRFLHDRIHQAVYSLIPENRKKSIHYQIGQLLLQEISLESGESCIFELVNHLNYGIPFLSQPEERERLACLNLRAGCKAKATTAYQSAREYVSTGLSLLPENAWQQQYQLTLELHELAAEISMLCGEFERAENFFEIVCQRARSVLDLVKVYEVKIQVSSCGKNFREALASGRQILEGLGVVFPEPLTALDINKEMSKIMQIIGDRNVEDLADLPAMVDGNKSAIVRIAIGIIPAAFNAGSPLFLFLSCLAVEISILSGNMVNSAHIYANYGIIVCKFARDIKLAGEFSQLALVVLDKLNALPVKSAVLTVIALFIKSRNSHLRETLPLFQKAFLIGLETGDLEHSGYSIYGLLNASFWCGQPLADLERDISKYAKELIQFEQLTIANYCRICQQTVFNLQGLNEEPAILSGTVFLATESLPLLLEAKDIFGVYSFYLNQLLLAFLFEEIDFAEQTGIEAKQHFRAAEGMIGEPLFYFYDSLTALAALNLDSERCCERLERVIKNQKSLQHWADYAPMNYQHKIDLVAAEQFRVLGKKAEALELYDRAILGAKVNQYIQEEALANELAAKFYLDWGKERIATEYMQEAYYCYARWGAQAKMADLEKRYPQLLNAILQPTLGFGARSNNEITITGTTGNSQLLDLRTIAQASQSISSEIVFEKLLAQLMALLIENAGAQRGILILAEGDSWQIEALGEMTETLETKTVKSFPLEESKNLPLFAIQYVQNTQSELVIADARRDERYRNDPYISQTQPQSILAAPILHQGKIVGIIYLENNLITDAFTSKRLQVINILASQAAISLENARLYRTLEQKVEERTAQLAAANAEITTLNQRLKQENIRMSNELDGEQVTLVRTEVLLTKRL